MARITAAVLLALLAGARGVGGGLLMLRGPKTVDSTLIGFDAARWLGLGLLIIAFAALAASYGLVRRTRWGGMLAMVVPVLFVFDGALNGYMLFGRPGDGGTIVNLIAAVIILTAVLIARAKEKTAGR